LSIGKKTRSNTHCPTSFCKHLSGTITIRHGEEKATEETFLPRLWLLPVLQRVSLRVVPLHLCPQREKRQEAEDAQTAFFEILIFYRQPPLSLY
jgi:hypothetical protein